MVNQKHPFLSNFISCSRVSYLFLLRQHDSILRCRLLFSALSLTRSCLVNCGPPFSCFANSDLKVSSSCFSWEKLWLSSAPSTFTQNPGKYFDDKKYLNNAVSINANAWLRSGKVWVSVPRRKTGWLPKCPVMAANGGDYLCLTLRVFLGILQSKYLRPVIYSLIDTA